MAKTKPYYISYYTQQVFIKCCRFFSSNFNSFPFKFNKIQSILQRDVVDSNCIKQGLLQIYNMNNQGTICITEGGTDTILKQKVMEMNGPTKKAEFVLWGRGPLRLK